MIRTARIAAAIAFVAALAGCASETTGPDTAGGVEVNLIVGNTDVTAVSFQVTCDSGINLSGQFNVNDGQDPPVWAAIMDLPPGDCSIAMTAFDNAGAPLCTGSQDFTVLVDQTIKVDVVLVCNVDGVDPLGNIDVDATFEIVVGNNCPRLHFLNAVPNNVPAAGSAVTVLVSDAEGDPLTTALSATGGSFADPSAQSTTYTCNGANGAQTISVTVSDGDPVCDKSKSFDVTCPGVNPCDGVVCPDTGNECTVAECNQSTGQCESSNVPNGTACNAGGGGELTVNGDFETGDTSGWEFFPNDGTFAATMAQANGGLWSGNLVASVSAGGPPSFPVIKQANLGVGVAQPNSSCDVSFDLFGSVSGAGGVFFAEFFSELSGGGTSSTEILSGGPLFPNGTWTTYSFTPATGNDVSGGVTLQLKADCGANPGCTVDAYIDNVSVNCGGNGGGPGTCQEGVCEPADLCAGVDCNDNNECTADECNPTNGQCESTATPGAACDGGAGTCDAAGTCQPNDLCIGVDCNDNNECTIDACDPATGNCSNTPDTGASCNGGAGTCDAAGTCQPNDLCIGVDCNDNNECTIDACDPGTGTCSNTPDTGASCDGGAGTCDAQGICQADPSCEYTQDFESLVQSDPDALANDGWVVGANVFAPDGTTFLYNYFAFPAPNGGPAFSAIDAGQGGAAQGAQQMAIYNDYNNADHNVGNVIEAIVFQERPVVAADIGNTISFTFDAKQGNIESPTTAQAFIKTLDPGAGFSESASDTLDTTSLGTTWGTTTLSIDILAGFEGHILQFGALSRAANFTPSGNFYDNMSVCSAQTP